jgi:hypothetical protein
MDFKIFASSPQKEEFKSDAIASSRQKEGFQAKKSLHCFKKGL